MRTVYSSKKSFHFVYGPENTRTFKPAFNPAVAMPMRVPAQNAGHHAKPKNDQREPDQPLRPVVESLGQAHMQLQYCNAQRHHRKRMAQCVRHAQPKPAPPVALHRGDVRNRSQMIVIEAMTQPQHQARTKCSIKFPVARDQCHGPSIEDKLTVDLPHRNPNPMLCIKAVVASLNMDPR